MSKRSLQASQEGARLARKAFDRKGWTQENLAAELELKTRQPIWRFFTCRPVERHIFVELCHILDLNWWEIAERPPEFLLEMVKDQQESAFSSPETKVESSIDLLVERVRESCRDWIENQCGVLRVLDTSRPSRFEELHIPVEVVQPFRAFPYFGNPVTNQEVTTQEVPSDLQKRASNSPAVSNRAVEQPRIPAIQAVKQNPKLRILGKPGSGKTSILKHVALQCIQGEVGLDKVPVLIHLDSFATYSRELGKYSLIEFLYYELAERGISDIQTLTTLLIEGRFLLLLDALDEVIEPENYAIYKEITRFSERYYKNQFVITARLASDRFEFSQFTDVKIADFTDEQVAALAVRWFQVFSEIEEEQLKLTQFLQQLRSPENRPIAELVRLPLLFNVIAQLFQKRGDLSAYHLEVYETCLNILFERWDQSRGINRSSSRFHVPVAIKQAVLMQIAAIGFQQHRFCFQRREITQWIEEYLYPLYPDGAASGIVQAMSKTVFFALEHHHGLLVENTQGLFSFAFPGFQSYFIAQWIASSKDIDSAIAVLTHPIADAQWQEVALLSYTLFATDEQLTEPIAQTLNSLNQADHETVHFVNWTQQIPLKSMIYQQLREGFVVWRLLLRTPDLLASHADFLAALHTSAQKLLLEVLLDSLLKCVLVYTSEGSLDLEKLVKLLNQAISLSNDAGYNSESQILQSLKQKLPGLNQPLAQLQNWWKTSYVEWGKELRQLLANWYEDNRYEELTANRQRLLGHYTYLKQLLADCASTQFGKPNYSGSDSSSFMPSCSICKQSLLAHSLQYSENVPSVFSQVVV